MVPSLQRSCQDHRNHYNIELQNIKPTEIFQVYEKKYLQNIPKCDNLFIAFSFINFSKDATWRIDRVAKEPDWKSGKV